MQWAGPHSPADLQEQLSLSFIMIFAEIHTFYKPNKQDKPLVSLQLGFQREGNGIGPLYPRKTQKLVRFKLDLLESGSGLH